LIDTKKEFPDWDSYYRENNVEKMPWYEKNLDPDLEYEIKSRNLCSGKFLDLGTGPGTQAIQLAKRGFSTTGSDLSKTAIDKAKKLSNDVNFVVDDFLNSKFPDNEFDFILDRGCFHVFDIIQRPCYVNQIKRILCNDGIIFLKCMSSKEKDLSDDKGPHKLSKEELTDTFSNDFEVENIKDTVYHGTLNPFPKALFAVLKKKL
jgi:SAM-dependent methyltransferase